MTEVIRKTEPKEETGTLVPLFPALPHWMERLDELFDRWPLHPLFRFPELCRAVQSKPVAVRWPACSLSS